MSNILGFNKGESAWICDCKHRMLRGEQFQMPPPSKKAAEYMIKELKNYLINLGYTGDL